MGNVKNSYLLFVNTVLNDSKQDLDVDFENLRTIIEEMIKVFSPRERDITRLSFGLDDGRLRTPEEVGELFEVPAEQVEQKLAKVLTELRKPEVHTPLKNIIK